MTRINVDLSDLLAPIKQMREEIQKMNDALRSTVQLQSQMAAFQRQAAGGYSPTKAGLALEIQDKIAARGGPVGNVYSIGTGAPIPPSNINPTGSPLGSILPSAQWQLGRGGVGIAQAFVGQAGFQNDLVAKREREEAIKTLSSSSSATSRILLDVSKRIEQERAAASEVLKRATEEYSQASEAGAKDLAKFAKELDEAAKKFNKVNQRAEQFSQTLDDFIKKGGPGGGGGEGGGGSWWDKYGGKAGRYASGAAAIVGFGLQAASDYQVMKALGFRETASALREIPQNIGTIESLRYQKMMTLTAPMSGEQFVEAYGNLLTPGKNTFQHLGVGNRQARESYAKTTVQEEFKAAQAEKSSAGMSAGAQALLGLTTLLGGAAFTAKTAGLGGLLGGFTAMGAGYSMLKGAYQSYTQAQTNVAGKVEGGVFDVTGAGLIHEKNDIRKQTQIQAGQTRLMADEEMTQTQLMQNEMGKIAARRLSMGIDENLAAMRMRTAATAMAGGAAVSGFEAFQNLSPEKAAALSDRYAKLGYSIPEVGQIYNTYAGMMGTTQGAGRLLGLSRAGVGSVEQMASNVLGISAVSGKQGDTKQLENIFAKAFEAGLKGAPAIQRFSQAAMEMSSALKIQSATGAAGLLSSLTGAMRGASGSATMYMEEAKSGLAGLAGATGATGGLIGTLKVLSGAGLGLGMGTGLGAVSRSNIVQVQEALGQLSEGGDYTKLTGIARKMVGSQIASGKTPAEAMAATRRALEGQLSVQAAPFAAEFERRTGGITLASVQAKAKEIMARTKNKDPKKAAAAKEELKNLFAQFEDQTVGMVGLEAEGASAALLMSDVAPGDFKKGQQILASEKAKGAGVAAADFATVNYKKYLNVAAQEASGALGRKDVSQKELLETATGLGIQGTDAEKIAILKGAAGVKGDQPMSFAQLTTAMSLLSSNEEVRAKNMVVQEFSTKAAQQLADALKGKVEGTQSMPDKPSVGASKTPEQIQQEKNRVRTRSAVGSMMP